MYFPKLFYLLFTLIFRLGVTINNLKMTKQDSYELSSLSKMNKV